MLIEYIIICGLILLSVILGLGWWAKSEEHEKLWQSFYKLETKNECLTFQVNKALSIISIRDLESKNAGKSE